MNRASPVAECLSRFKLDGMVRAALWAVLTCAVAPACGSKDSDSARAAQPGAVAGKVLEVSGSVKVGAKQLAVGDQVKTDDQIETGADGTVVIELAHNQARWELGPGHKVRPTESVAWTQERHGSAGAVDQDTSAAGRPAERSAADTGTTAKAAATADTAAPPSAQPAPSAAAPAAAATPMAPKAAPAPRSVAPPPPSLEPSTTAAAPKPSEERSRGPAVRDTEAPSGASGGGAAGESSGTLTADMFVKLSECVPANSRVHVKIHVAKHVPAITFDADTDAAVKKCITDAATKLSIGVTSGDLSLTLRR